MKAVSATCEPPVARGASDGRHRESVCTCAETVAATHSTALIEQKYALTRG